MTESTPLQRELKQTRPFLSKGQEATLSILRTADRIRRRLGGVLDPFGVTLQQYNVLRILRGARGEPLPTLEIGERMIEEAPGVTRLLDRLERKGLVRRSRCTYDRRQVHCFITDEGLELLAAIDPLLDDADAQVVAGLPDETLGRLIEILDQVRESAG